MSCPSVSSLVCVGRLNLLFRFLFLRSTLPLRLPMFSPPPSLVSRLFRSASDPTLAAPTYSHLHVTHTHTHIHLLSHTYTHIHIYFYVARLGRLAHPPARLPTHSPTHPLARSLQVTFARQYRYYSDLLRSDSILTLTYSYLLIQIQTIYAFRETSILPLVLFDFLTFECPVFRWSSVATYIPCRCLFSHRA